MALEPRGAEGAAQLPEKNVLAHGQNSSMSEDFKQGLLLQMDTDAISKRSDFLTPVPLKLAFAK